MFTSNFLFTYCYSAVCVVAHLYVQVEWRRVSLIHLILTTFHKQTKNYLVYSVNHFVCILVTC